MTQYNVTVRVDFILEVDTDLQEHYPESIFHDQMSRGEIACAMARFDADQPEPIDTFATDQTVVAAFNPQVSP